MTLNHDLHVHTYLSACCQEKERQRPQSILALAAHMGVRTIGFADHVWANPDLAPSGWYRPQDGGQITRLRADLEGLSTGTRVLVGCEAETVAPGKFGIVREFAEGLDFVLLACSHFHMRDFVAQPASPAPRDVADHVLAFFRSGVSSGLATAIAHPLIPLGYVEAFDDAIASMSDGELADAFGLARDHGVAIEITTAFLPSGTHPLFSIETPIRFLTIARQVDCMFTLATDAHGPRAQKRLPELARLIEPVGLGDGDFLPLAMRP